MRGAGLAGLAGLGAAAVAGVGSSIAAAPDSGPSVRPGTVIVIGGGIIGGSANLHAVNGLFNIMNNLQASITVGQLQAETESGLCRSLNCVAACPARCEGNGAGGGAGPGRGGQQGQRGHPLSGEEGGGEVNWSIYLD